MEACVMRLRVNNYYNVLRIINIRSTRLLCSTKDGELSPPDNVNQTHSTSNEDVAENTVQNETDRETTKNASHGNEGETSQTKLLSVLSGLKVNNVSRIGTVNSKISRPPRRLGKKFDDIDLQLRRFGHGKDVVSAVKAVASSLGGDVEKREQELVQTFTSIDKGLQIEEPDKKTTKAREIKDEIELDENLISAVRAVASVVSGDPVQTESELTKKLLSIAAEGSFNPTVVSEIVEGMKVEKKKSEPQEITRKPSATRPIRDRKLTELEIDLFNGTPLNVFKLENKDEPQESPQLMIWHELQKKELRSLVQYSPSNAFEEMIQWTEQGKLWTFPINNEAGMHEEENVGFHEHVFLDHLLEGFPKKGPIRHFMNLVITGLSKNPYMSVQRKAEHVEWYRKYLLEDNKEILQQYENTENVSSSS